MEDILRIKGSNCGLFSNAAHLNFHQRVYDRVNLLAKRDVYRIDTIFEEYGGCLEDETERTLEGQGTGKSIDLSELDRKRDEAAWYLLQQINSSEMAPIEAMRTAARVLIPVVAPYKGIQSEAMDKETALIGSLLHDLNKDEYTDQVTALNLQPTMDALEEANNEYIQMKDQRTDEYLDRKLSDSKTLRKHTDAVYQRLCDLIYANMLLLPEEGSMVALEKLVKEINMIIDEANASYKLSKSLKKSKKKDVLPEESEEGEGGSFEPIPAK